ncbi:uncharacterized protein AMSG_05955 [Thecamonas trahens ATCC 50062]|uniref:Uncharacterized protein n=1 Tax=Thecamonas trahens ATCC 50062 TaxID=461836 RepID=A0A0L0DBI0_THETB|nr:hypothetical protein AMSG_05955 [Thecamonas trahens ATCC 50062]KNC49692.1 hypothetical protein AMSG_05955 [Thecamonas trahens ATCC 50062]|eukprot:XP_013757487.1 hypothetical protein AMSG_05955 [Thecamonas trahens ATCC 50062]
MRFHSLAASRPAFIPLAALVPDAPRALPPDNYSLELTYHGHDHDHNDHNSGHDDGFTAVTQLAFAVAAHAVRVITASAADRVYVLQGKMVTCGMPQPTLVAPSVALAAEADSPEAMGATGAGGPVAGASSGSGHRSRGKRGVRSSAPAPGDGADHGGEAGTLDAADAAGQPRPVAALTPEAASAYASAYAHLINRGARSELAVEQVWRVVTGANGEATDLRVSLVSKAFMPEVKLVYAPQALAHAQAAAAALEAVLEAEGWPASSSSNVREAMRAFEAALAQVKVWNGLPSRLPTFPDPPGVRHPTAPAWSASPDAPSPFALYLAGRASRKSEVSALLANEPFPAVPSWRMTPALLSRPLAPVVVACGDGRPTSLRWAVWLDPVTPKELGFLGFTRAGGLSVPAARVPHGLKAGTAKLVGSGWQPGGSRKACVLLYGELPSGAGEAVVDPATMDEVLGGAVARGEFQPSGAAFGVTGDGRLHSAAVPGSPAFVVVELGGARSPVVTVLPVVASPGLERLVSLSVISPAVAWAEDGELGRSFVYFGEHSQSLFLDAPSAQSALVPRRALVRMPLVPGGERSVVCHFSEPNPKHVASGEAVQAAVPATMTVEKVATAGGGSRVFAAVREAAADMIVVMSWAVEGEGSTSVRPLLGRSGSSATAASAVAGYSIEWPGTEAETAAATTSSKRGRASVSTPLPTTPTRSSAPAAAAASSSSSRLASWEAVSSYVDAPHVVGVYTSELLRRLDGPVAMAAVDDSSAALLFLGSKPRSKKKEAPPPEAAVAAKAVGSMRSRAGSVSSRSLKGRRGRAVEAEPAAAAETDSRNEDEGKALDTKPRAWVVVRGGEKVVVQLDEVQALADGDPVVRTGDLSLVTQPSISILAGSVELDLGAREWSSIRGKGWFVASST